MTEFDEPDDTETEPKRNFRRELEDRASTAEQRAAALERENAIYKAGLHNLTERQVSVLSSQLGDDKSPDAVKALATELGWAEVKPEPDPPKVDQAAMDRMDAAAATGTPLESDTNAAYEAEMQAARTPAEADAVMAKYGRGTNRYLGVG